MYFKNIFCVETQQLIDTEKVELVTNIGTLDGNLFEIEEISEGDFLRIKPKFNCERIESSNLIDRVINQKECLICENNKDTVITCY